MADTTPKLFPHTDGNMAESRRQRAKPLLSSPRSIADSQSLTPPSLKRLNPVDDKPVIGLLDLPNELLLQIFRDVARFTLDPRNVELGIFLRKRRSIRTFLGYGGLNHQLLPVIRGALFTELRPIMRSTHTPQNGHNESYLIEYPYFDLFRPMPGLFALDFSKLGSSRWNEELRYLRIEILLITPNSLDVVEEILGIAASVAIHFKALIGLEVKIEASYGQSVQASSTEEEMTVDLRRRLEDKGCKRRVEVTVRFRGHGGSWAEEYW